MHPNAETAVSISRHEQQPHVLRLEQDGWLAFNTISHSVTNLGDVALGHTSMPQNIVRVIEHDSVEGAMSAPLKLFVSVSDMCNLACTHCLSDSSPQGHTSLSPDSLKAISYEAAELGVFQITIGGGEPLIYKGIWDVIRHMRSLHLGVSITTNGIVVRESDLDNIQSYNVRTNVSIDGSPETHDRIRNKAGAYAKTVSNIERMIDRGIRPALRFTLMQSNLQDVDHMISLSEQLGLELKPRRAKPSGRVIGASEIITEQSNEYLEATLKLNAAGNCGLEDLMNLNPSPKDDLILSDTDCGAGTRIAYIDEDGSLSPCTFLGKDFVTSKWEPGELTAAWKGSKEFVDIRNLKQNEECGSCARHDTCHSECPAMRLHVGGSLDAQDPGCIKPLVQFLGSTIEKKNV